MGSSTDNEFGRWMQLTEGQKSFAVQLLHFFHYRPRCVGRSWTREEVLTWELYRALTLLPRTILLVPFLRLCADAVWTAKPAISELLADPDAIRVVAYPRLNLSGNKRNCASDIGLCRLDDPRLWVEIKTATVPAAVLSSQLRLQRARLRELAKSSSVAVIPLVPAGQRVASEPALRWAQVLTVLEAGLQILAEHPARELASSLAYVVGELHERIKGHAPKLAV